MAEIQQMIVEVRADRQWFHDCFERTRAAGTPNYGLSIDAAACAIRERALLDALAALNRTGGGDE